MTEEEKKEFEEFLQWKAERAKKQEAEKNSLDSNENTIDDENGVQPMTTGATDNNSESLDRNRNRAISLILLIVAILIIFFVGISLRNTRETKPILAEVEDNVALAVDEEEPVSEPIIDAKQDSIDRVERISAVKKTIKIKSAYLGRPNSASGVDAYFYYKNMSDKTIKYLVWEGYPMNAVGDRVSCEIRGYRDFRGQDTGPIKPGKSSGGCWGCAWYNSTAKKLVLTGIDIEYMDGTTFSIKENEIEYIR